MKNDYNQMEEIFSHFQHMLQKPASNLSENIYS